MTPEWLIPFGGTLFRIAFAKCADSILDGVIHPEGRFHHDGQPALYASPTPEGAAIAIDVYVKPHDPDRVLIPLKVSGARLADLRDRTVCDRLNIDPDWPSVPWADQRAQGRPATSWQASDAVRATSADGMIYRSRRAPDRWHVVLFAWNREGAVRVTVDAQLSPWSPN